MVKTDKITVTGLQPESITVPLNNLVVKSLCRKHNSKLSPLDQVGADFVNHVIALNQQRMFRSKQSRRTFPPVRPSLNGLLLEQWLLKIVMGLVYVKSTELNGWQPKEAAGLIFGIRPFPANTGLSLLHAVGETIHTGEQFTLQLGKRPDDNNPTAARIEIRGYRFILTWEVQRDPVAHYQFDDNVYSANLLMHHPKKIIFNHGAKDLRLSLHFHW